MQRPMYPVIAGLQDMTCKERLPESLPEPHEACLQTFLDSALNLSPATLMPTTTFGGGTSFGVGLDTGLVSSPLPRLDQHMFYGGPLESLGGAQFTDLGESSFSFSCFN